MQDSVTLMIEIDGKKYGTTRKVSLVASDRNMLFCEAIKAVNFIFKDIDKDLLEKAIKKAGEAKEENNGTI